MEGGDLFWGLVVKPGKRYESKVENAFRLTKACLEPSTAGGKVSSVMVECDTGENFILANLNLKTCSENLNVSFNDGEKICFKVDGPGTVHLTGNLAPDQESMQSMMMDDSSDDEDISQLEDIALEAQRIRDGIKTLPSGGVGGESSGSEDEEDEEDEDEEDEEDDEEESSDGEEEEDGSDEKQAAPDANDSGKRKLDSEGDDAKRMKVDGSESEEGDSEEDDDEDEDSDEDDSEEDGGDDLPNFDDINTKDLTAAQVKKLEMVKKMFEAAKGKVAKEADIFEKNKAAGATKKVGDVNDNVKPKEVKSKEEKTAKGKLKAQPAKDSSIAAVTKEALAQKEKSEKAAALAKIKANPSQQKEWTLKGGVTIEELQKGTGEEAKKGNFVGMFYSGKVQGRKKTFDSCLSGKPFRFRLGSGQVITGWERGILGMREGGKRRLTLAPNMGYGAGGAPPDIPGNATLVFDIECKYVKKHASQEKL